MHNMVKVVAATALLAISNTVLAQDKNQPDNPWTDCGIGYALFKNSEVGAAISNVIWDAGTTATTTFVSTPDNCREREAKVAQFIGESYDTLENEIAVGSGEHLDTLVQVANCKVESGEGLITAIRRDFAIHAEESSFVSMAKVDKAELFFNIVASQINGDFSKDCSII